MHPQDRDLRALRKRITACPRNTRGHRLYPSVLKQDVTRFVIRHKEDGTSQSHIADQLGIAQAIVHKWVWEFKTGHNRGQKMRIVTVKPETGQGVVLEGAAGIKVHGLSLQDIADVLVAAHAG
jgi:hypothetical protein